LRFCVYWRMPIFGQHSRSGVYRLLAAVGVAVCLHAVSVRAAQAAEARPAADLAAVRQLAVTPVSGQVGTEVSVPVTIDDATGAVGFLMRLTYPAALAQYTGFEPGALTSSWGNPIINIGTPGEIVIVNAGVEALAGTGTLVVLKFQLVAAGSSTFGLAVVELNDGALPAEGTTGVAFDVTPVPGRQLTLDPVAGVMGTRVGVPILINDATGVVGYWVKLTYPPGLASFAGARAGALTVAWADAAVNGSTPGQVVVAGSGATALAGAGALIILEFDLITPGTGVLALPEVELNDGAIAAQGAAGVAFAVSDGIVPRQFSVDPASGDEGTQVEVPVLIDNATGVVGYSLHLIYPATLAQYAGGQAGTLTGGWSAPVINSSVPGEIIVVGAGATALSGAGSVVKLRFDLTTPGTGSIRLDAVELNDGATAATAAATVPLTVRDTTVYRQASVNPVGADEGTRVEVPVHIDDANGVVGYFLRLTYPAALATYAGLQRGTLTGGWGNPVVNSGTPGQLIVAGSGATPLSGSGSLVILQLDLTTPGTGVMDLAEFELNDGAIAAQIAVPVAFDVYSLGPRQVSIAAVSAGLDTEVDVPVLINDSHETLGYVCRIVYPHGLAEYTGFERGSLTESWGDPVVNPVSAGELIVVGAGVEAASGSGSLVVLKFLTTHLGSSTIAVTAAELNDGAIAAEGAAAATFTVGKSDQTITFAALAARTYGDADFVLTATASSGLPVTFTSLNEDVATVSGNSVTMVAGGQATIRALQAGNGQYNPAPEVDQILTVNKATLTVTADGKSRAYGAANPPPTLQYSGWVGDDGVADLATAPTAVCSATPTSNVGNHAIVPGGGEDESYSFTYVNGTLAVTKASLTATAENKARAYGEANPPLTIAYSGFVNGEDSSVLDASPGVSTPATLESPPENYAILLSGGSDNNYDLELVNGTLSIGLAAQTIAFAALDPVTYGDPSFNLTATASSNLSVSYVSLNTSVATVSGSTVTIVGAGTATIRAAQAGNGNYEPAPSVEQTLSVAKKQLNVTAADQSRNYGAANPSFSLQYAGWVGGDGVPDLDTPPTAGTAATVTSDTGTYAITPSGGADNNYSFAYVDGALTVTQASLMATADNKSRPYGDVNPPLTITYTGFLNGDDAGDLDTVPAISTTAVIDSPVGDYPITLTGGSDNNYDLDLSAGALAVVKASQVITFGVLPGKVYGDADFALGATASSNLPVSYVSLNTSVATVSGSTVTLVGAGTATIRASQAGNGNCAPAPSVEQTLSVAKKPLTVTAVDQSRSYGATNPPFPLQYAGWVGGGGVPDLDTPPTAGTAATVTSDTGTYAITSSGGADNNYSFAHVDGTLTVTKAPLTVTADNKFRPYGEANPPLTITYTGFLNGDDAGDLDTAPAISTTAVIDSPVGDYPIALTGGSDNNYALALVEGTLSVGKTSQAITFNPLPGKTYGDAPFTISATASSGLPVTFTSLTPAVATVSGDTVTIHAAGAATIRASQGGNAEYGPAPTVDRVLTVAKANLTVTADNKSRSYGTANPPFTLQYAGWVGSDGSGVLDSLPTAGTGATAISPVGTYAITPSGGADNNYAFAYVDGTLTVTAATLTVTADDTSRAYGSANPPLTVSYSGFMNGETVAVLAPAPVPATVAGPVSPVGTYPITLSGGSAQNYALVLVSGTLTVTKADQSITFDALPAKTYGDPSFSVAATASSGLAVTFTSLTPGVITADGTTVTIVGAGTATLRAAQSGNTNYNAATTVERSFAVGKKTLTVTAADRSRAYGAANPGFTLDFAGWVGDDDSGDLTALPTASCTATATSNVGNYEIVPAGGSDANYTFTYVKGTLTIAKASLTATAQDTSRPYGQANPALTLSYAGFANGETAGVLDAAPAAATTAVPDSPPGAYVITLSGGSDNNYEFVLVSGTLTVTQAGQTITFAELPGKTYGDADFDLSATASSNLPVSYVSLSPSVATVSGSTVTIVGAGTATIRAAQTGDANYSAAPVVERALTVAKKTLTVTADDQGRTYGAANPAFTLQYAGWAGADDTGDLGTAPTAACGAVPASDAGPYGIVATGGADDNYDFVYVNGTLTVAKAPLTISADDTSRAFGTANPELTLSFAGFVLGQDRNVLDAAPTAATTVTPASAPGNYPIELSGGSDGNYAFTLVQGTLTITTAAQTITFEALPGRTYGDADFALTATASSGLPVVFSSLTPAVATVAGDTVHIAGAGQATLRAVQSGNANYDPAPAVERTLEVARKSLTATADNKSRVYGVENPTLTVSYNGFVGSDGVGVLDEEPVAATTAAVDGPVGIYPITLSGGSDDNYSFVLVDGVLEVGRTPQAIAFPEIAAKTYGDADVDLTATASSGLPVSFASSDATVATVTGSTIHIVGAGTATITASQAGDENYAPAANVNRTLTVNRKTLTVVAADKSRTYGAANPAFTLQITGWVGDDDVGDLAVAPTATCTATPTSPVGAYDIVAGGGADDNYDFACNSGALSVTKAPLTATADNRNRTYATTNPPLTISYAGFVNSEDSSVLAPAPTAATVADLASPAGTYPITLSGGSAVNYSLTLVNGTLSVTQASQAITFDALPGKTYGDADFALTVSASSGLTVAYTSLNEAVATISGNTVTLVGAGSATIRASQPGNTNYSAAPPVEQTLTVGKKELTVIAENKACAYGAANPPLTLQYAGWVGTDSVQVLDTPPVAACAATVSSDTGAYPITASGGADNNYGFAYTAGTLTVTRAPLTVTADNKSRAAGAPNPALTVTYTGFLNGDDATDLDTLPVPWTAVLDNSTDVGGFPITFSVAGDDNNYALTQVDGALSVGLIEQAITFDPLGGKTYGDAAFDLVASIVPADLGVVFASLNTGVATVSGTTVTIVGAGSATIRASQPGDATHAPAPNVDQVLVVAKAPLTATADNQARPYGQGNPALTITYSGFVNSETKAVLDAEPTVSTAATLDSPIGDYPIVLSGGGDPNYALALINGTLTVGKSPQTISFVQPADRTYGDTAFDAGASSDSGLEVALTSLTPAVVTVSGSTVTIVGAGTATLRAEQAGDANYAAATPFERTFTVAKKDLDVTADEQAREYGQANPLLTLTYAGFVPGEDETFLDEQPAVVTTAFVDSAPGEYPIELSGGSDANYALTLHDSTLTVTQAQQVIAFPAIAGRTYGDAPFAVNATASSGLAVTYASLDETVATVSGSTVTVKGAGVATIRATQPGNANYAAAPDVTRNFTVARKSLIATAENKSRPYGQANPPLTVAYTGFAAGDNASVLDQQPTVATAVDAASPVGTYPITLSGGSDANYALTLQNGTLTITKASQTITFAALEVKTYGAAAFALTATASSGLPVAFSSLNTSVATVAGSTVTIVGAGTATIRAAQAGDGNYAAAPNLDRVLTVNKKMLTVSADNGNRIYGAPNPAFTLTYTGWADTDLVRTLGTWPTATCEAVTTSSIGVYAIIPAGGVDRKYSFTYVNGTLTVTQAPLTATADNKSRPYGQANPVFTITYSGFMNGETAAVLDVAPGISTLATVGSNVGTYAITLSGGSDGNYALTLVNGTLTISRAGQTISFAALSGKTYGDASFGVTPTASSGLPISFVSSAPAVATVAGSTVSITGAGSTTLTASQAGDANWLAAPDVPRTLAVAKKALVARAEDKTRPYLAANPALTIAYSGFVSGEDHAVLDQEPSASTLAPPTSPVAAYPITLSGGSDGNYALTLVNGTLTITPAGQTITFDPLADRAYGDAAFNLSASASSGLAVTFTSLNNDVATVSGSTVTITGAGTATIRATQPGNVNYGAAPQVDRTLTVHKKTLTVTAHNKSRNYGSANPAFTLQLSGWVGGDGLANLATVPTATCMATVTSNTGDYPIVPVGGVDEDYDFTYINGILSVAKASLTATADDQSRQYGQPNPPLTVRYAGFVNGENSAVLDTLPTVSTTATVASPVGDYAIRLNDGSDGNYALTLVNGTLTITPASQTITFDALSDKTYGAAAFNLTASASSGLPVTFTSMNNDVATISGITVTIAGAGTVTLRATQPGNANCSAAPQVDRILIVAKATLTATADNQSRAYRTADPVFAISYTGFVNGETASALDALPTAATTATFDSPPGVYPITLFGGSDANYDLSRVGGTLTIINLSPVIEQAGPLCVIMDENGAPRPWAAPVLTASYDGAGVLNWSLLSSPKHGLATVRGTGGAPTVFHYAPAADWCGTDRFSVQVTDGFGLGDAIEIEVRVAPSDAQGLVVSAPDLWVVEGETASFSVCLAARPLGAVNVNVTVAGRAGAVSVLDHAAMVFSVHNWNVPQTVLVLGCDDADTTDASTVLNIADSQQALVARDLSVTVLDDDRQGICVSARSLAVAEGGQCTLGVSLMQAPTGPVTVDACWVCGAEYIALSGRQSLTFGPGDWNTPQTLTVSAPDDGDVEDRFARLQLSATGVEDIFVDVQVLDGGATQVLNLEPGWNLISICVDAGTATLASLFSPPCVGAIWRWDALLQGYVNARTEPVEPLVGYWVYCGTRATVQVVLQGEALPPVRRDLSPGWDLIGPLDDSPKRQTPGLLGGVWVWTGGDLWGCKDGYLSAAGHETPDLWGYHDGKMFNLDDAPEQLPAWQEQGVLMQGHAYWVEAVATHPWYPFLFWDGVPLPDGAGDYAAYQVEIWDGEPDLPDSVRLAVLYVDEAQAAPCDWFRAGAAGLLPGGYAWRYRGRVPQTQAFESGWHAPSGRQRGPLAVADYGYASPPADLSVADLGNGCFEIGFRVENAQGYRVDITGPNGFRQAWSSPFLPDEFGVIPINRDQVVTVQLPGSGVYTWQVCGYNPLDTAESVQAWQTGSDLVVPAGTSVVPVVLTAPVAVWPVDGDVIHIAADGTGWVELSWQPVSGAVDYLVYLGADGQGTLYNYEQVGNVTRLRLRLPPGCYLLSVQAVSVAGSTGPAVVRHFTVLGADTAPVVTGVERVPDDPHRLRIFSNVDSAEVATVLLAVFDPATATWIQCTTELDPANRTVRCAERTFGVGDTICIQLVATDGQQSTARVLNLE